MCFLSVLDLGDTAQTSHASEVVNTLSQYSISDYKGTTASEKNFQENLEALHHYRPTSHESIEPDDVPAPEERKFSKARRGPKTGPLSPPPDASDDELEGFISASGLDSEILKTALQKRLAETGGPLEGFDQSLILKYAMRMMTNEEASDDITRELAEDTLNRPDDERNGAAPNFEVENWHVDPQNGSNHMLGPEGPGTPASIPNDHESMEEVPYTNTELSAGHAVNDQSTQVPHPGRNILSHRKRRPPQTQTHTVGLPIGRSSSHLTTRTSTNEVPGIQIRPTVHQATAPVKEWFDAHGDSPYASNEEKAALANSTGLTLKQIGDCLSNLRARNTLNSTKSASENEASSIYSPANIPPMSSWAIGTPPARSSSTDFPQLPELLQNAIENKVHGSVEAARKLSHQSSSAMAPELPSSPSVPEDLQGVARLDFGRKGKKRFMRTLNPASEGTHALTNDYKDEDGWSFQCTFCLKRCKNSYEWKRHEGTHVVARTWTCMPENVATKGNGCVFCDLKFPSLAHLGEHNIHVCLKKALPARTFARKDHLKQHIEQVHLPGQDNGFSNLDEILDRWSRDADESEFASGVLWCGFCSTSFKSWGERVKHISSHFKAGAKMVDWRYKPV
ncbi:uncharacterized protein K441DRAFT_678823 [Cenococcum geophilum 1.58]|uniref:uncharacterized protein n=1 Tax=Cenococcum geophilum 1.58 TaxID=794803 RepID=UPI00358E5D9D|nr:hypothetical protein K441DRAFT_678823 [Cenococcum geophilum 1.58]